MSLTEIAISSVLGVGDGVLVGVGGIGVLVTVLVGVGGIGVGVSVGVGGIGVGVDVSVGVGGIGVGVAVLVGVGIAETVKPPPPKVPLVISFVTSLNGRVSVPSQLAGLAIAAARAAAVPEVGPT